MNAPAFPWTEQTESAALQLAAGLLPDTQIAERLGVDRKTLWRWRQHSEFAARIDDHLAALRAEVRRRGLANRDLRVKALNDRWSRLQSIIEARADDPDVADVPGGTTGLLVKTVRLRGSGDEIEKTIEAEVDVALLKELREIEKQAAQELGQWVEKSVVDQVTKAYVKVGPEEL